MAKVKKFGMFGGVFTPSILTILGVIMYLRFPSIIGQAGLINTIGIILIAHIISITTSLSVASLSTDKPVQNGGTYFMISRSLGLPIGGTLGFALFVGFAFSVSLYLIGFAESFIQYFGYDHTINNIRLIGSIVLFAVTTITFISTSLAIKSQYFIMGAIALSLLSIFLGHHEFTPHAINWQPMADAAPFMLLFGIFFPAVTGFEAGVSMSGDLKDPKKALPLGAILAVGVGLIVYITLALFYAFTVDANALVNDPQILFKISLVPTLVIIGIWGATLSSALGSILGAPRILQAIAMDKMAPKAFAKGTGATNEPRNALLLAFAIAQIGILIGELDVIARIVSMFFITTYAFLNLASAIESWSSSDFRPAFRIPRFVSILGALSAFIVMILLDFLALAGATIVLGLLFFYIRRKELVLEGGDAWSSFWTNLAKKALLKLSSQHTDKRNWRPNIIVFSGGGTVRPQLIEMGLSISGKLGTLTDFNLVVDNQGNSSTKMPTYTTSKTNHFTRAFPCSSVEEGMKQVTNVYGFSGFEPNTVLVGWSKEIKSGELIRKILVDFEKKQLNVAFLDYHKTKGFGKKATIDIWWNGKGRHLNFSLSVLRFIQSDAAWRDVKVRILVINNDSSLVDKLHTNIQALLTDKRMKAEIKIVSDNFGSNTIGTIINRESENSDLLMIGLSKKYSSQPSKQADFVGNSYDLPASTLILSPSDEFEAYNFIEKTGVSTQNEPDEEQADLPKIKGLNDEVLNAHIEKLDTALTSCFVHYSEASLDPISKQWLLTIKSIKDLIVQNATVLERETSNAAKLERLKSIIRNHQLLLINVNYLIKTRNDESLNAIGTFLEEGIAEFISKIDATLELQPQSVQVITINANERKKKYSVKFKNLASYHAQENVVVEFEKQLTEIEKASIHILSSIRQVIFDANDIYEKLLLSTTLEVDDAVSSIRLLSAELEGIEKQVTSLNCQTKGHINTAIRACSNQIALDLMSPQLIGRDKKKGYAPKPHEREFLTSFAGNWVNGIHLIKNTIILDSLVLSEQKIAINLLVKSNDRIRTIITDAILSPITNLLHNLAETQKGDEAKLLPVHFTADLKLQPHFRTTYDKIVDVANDFPDDLALPEVMYVNSDYLPLADYTPVSANVGKTSIHYFDMLFYIPFYQELEKLEQALRAAVIECKEANSLLMFRLNNTSKNKELPVRSVMEDEGFTTKLINQVSQQKLLIETFVQKVEQQSTAYLHASFSKLYYHSIIEAESRLSKGKREQKSKRFSSSISAKVKAFKTKVNSVIVNVLYSSSKGIILSKKYFSANKDYDQPIGNVLDAVEKLLPDAKAYIGVPGFYRSLFSSGSKINDELWVSRPEEVNLLKKAIQRHRLGYGGATLITGVHGAGKTALCQYAASNLLRKKKVYWINSPLNGSTSLDTFLNELREKVGSNDDFSGILSRMEEGSTIIINDLELWWERSDNGTVVVKKMVELIEAYGKKVFFVINCNIHSFHVINKLINFQNSCSTVVECGYFNALELQALVMSRHKSSGITAQYKGQSEDDISQLSQSLLFNSYFNFSSGIPGAALNAWKANIIKANSKEIVIQKPVKPNMDVLHQLQAEWLVVLALFIQHKHMDSTKLSRIMEQTISESNVLLNGLFNAGLLVPKELGVFTLGRNVEPFIVKVCESKGLI